MVSWSELSGLGKTCQNYFWAAPIEVRLVSLYSLPSSAVAADRCQVIHDDLHCNTGSHICSPALSGASTVVCNARCECGDQFSSGLDQGKLQNLSAMHDLCG